MGTTTQRTVHIADDSYTDVITSIPGAANATGFLRHFGGNEVEIVKGGSTPPADDVRGIPLKERGDEWCEADHIWVRCRFDGTATIGFDLLS